MCVCVCVCVCVYARARSVSVFKRERENKKTRVSNRKIYTEQTLKQNDKYAGTKLQKQSITQTDRLTDNAR